MSADPDLLTAARPSFPARTVRPDAPPIVVHLWIGTALLALGSVFVLIGGGNLDLGEIEARLGLAAAEQVGPFGQVFGGWDPGLWPARVIPSALWAWGEGGTPTAASVRWPEAIAGLLAGLILARHTRFLLGAWAGFLTGLCWFGSVALIDRSAGAGLDLITGLATTAALGRILSRGGSDLVAGLWAALAFLAAGWPPLALILLVTLVIGRREVRLTPRVLVPPLVAAAAWSAWALSVAPAQAWAAALALPLTQPGAWLMPFGVVALGLPWSPFALLAASRSVRDGWPAQGRAWVLDWLQVTGASLLAGTVIPGMAPSARLPALAGLAVTAAACLERLWARSVSTAARRGFLVLAAALVALWVAIAVGFGISLASAVPYYRRTVIVLVALAPPIGLLTLSAVLKADPRRALPALAAVAVCLKLAHWGYYVPEWNYRFSQGPWGRAIGQWVPPHWPIYVTHAWPADLAFATGRTIRQLDHPRLLGFQAGPQPKFVLLLAAEFEHWPKEAPPLVRVASFQDERGASRILARTEGEFPWDRLARRPNED